MQSYTRRLDNGLQVVALRRPGALTTLLSVDIGVGSASESKADNGLSHFLEHMIFQGCEGFPTPEAVNDAAERMGAALDASTGRESTRVEHWIDPSKLASSVDLVARILRSPRFESIESEREIIIEEALDEVDETGRMVDADSISRRDIWPVSGYGQRVIGEERNLRRFEVDDLKRHHRTYYHAGNMVAAVVTPDDPQAALDTVCEALATLPGGTQPPRPSPGPDPEGPFLHMVPDARSQCDVRIAFRTPGRVHADALAISMLRTALDDGLASRMHRRLGAELGLAYHQWAAWEPYHDTGAFEIGAEVSPSKLRVFVDEAQKLLVGLVDAPPRGDELDLVRFRVDWALRCMQESAEGLVTLYATPHLYGEPIESGDDLRARAAAITPEDLADTADRIFVKGRSASCFVGDMDKGTRRAVKHLSRRFRTA